MPSFYFLLLLAIIELRPSGVDGGTLLKGYYIREFRAITFRVRVEEGITYFRVSHLLPFFAEGWMLQFVCYYFDHHQEGKKLDRLLVIDAERVFVI